MTELSESDLARIVTAMRAAITQEFTERSHIDAKTHEDHHSFVARQKERYERCQANRQLIVNGMLISIGVAAALAFSAWLWTNFKQTVRDDTPVIERAR